MIDRPMMITLEEYGLVCRWRDAARAHPCPDASIITPIASKRPHWWSKRRG